MRRAEIDGSGHVRTDPVVQDGLAGRGVVGVADLESLVHAADDVVPNHRAGCLRLNADAREGGAAEHGGARLVGPDEVALDERVAPWKR